MKETGRLKETKTREKKVMEEEMNKSPDQKVEEIVQGILKKRSPDDKNLSLVGGLQPTSYRTQKVDLHEHDILYLAENLRL